MLLAQALGEYVGLAGFSEGFNDLTLRLEDVVRDWGTEGLMVLVAVGVVWKVFTSVR